MESHTFIFLFPIILRILFHFCERRCKIGPTENRHLKEVKTMSKYNSLWEYVQSSGSQSFKLTYLWKNKRLSLIRLTDTYYEWKDESRHEKAISNSGNVIYINYQSQKGIAKDLEGESICLDMHIQILLRKIIESW